MTLAMALRAYDGLVLATDSRATGGPRLSVDTSEKFLQVNRDIGVMTYGLAGPGYTGISRLVEAVKSKREELTYFRPIADAAGDVFRGAYNECGVWGQGDQRIERGVRFPLDSQSASSWVAMTARLTNSRSPTGRAPSFERDSILMTTCLRLNGTSLTFS